MKVVPLGKLNETTIDVQLREDEIEDVNEYLHRVCEARKEKLGADRGYEGELGYYGPTYAAAKAATIAPSYFVRGLPTSPDDLRAHQTPSKINAAIDIILNQIGRDEVNEVPPEKLSKYTIHCDSRQAEPAVLLELASRGLNARVYDGWVNQKERRRIEIEVNRDEDHPASTIRRSEVPPLTRIVYCSAVAEAGVGLFRTNIVINLTTPWSHFSYEQRNGRHHRTSPVLKEKLLSVQFRDITGINSADNIVCAFEVLSNNSCSPDARDDEIDGRLVMFEVKGDEKETIYPLQGLPVME